MSLIEQELGKYTGLSDNQLDAFLFILKNKGFLEADNSLQILLKMFEASYSKGKMDLLKDLTKDVEANIGEEW